ncbi:dynamin family protein [Acetobacter vaccinii]|uniref:Dynamin N-terminal domain-containing protein n=1 Tax=Acetobacter vaccinii TaxID=2592655 RepID=A0A5C1YSV3_9PROT|nr:dynamin family protein [Acetobacter vaccinii]QEO18903.1 hypothetical protein FLP30_13590 [Acetobacter vaccinii]
MIPLSCQKFKSRNDFLNFVSALESESRNKNIARAEHALYQMKKDLDEVFGHIDQATHTMENQVRSVVAARKAKLDSDDGLEEMGLPALYNERKTWVSAITSYHKNIVSKIEEYQRRNHFSLKYGQGRMACVFGKVKAGKSSLGNFVAYEAISPDAHAIKSVSPQPTFFYETSSGLNEKMSPEIMARQRAFGIGIAETTSSIQGFSLPGFTWVDTPGVDSVNASNGDLAYQYVDASDLIIYTLNSSSPQRESDRTKILSFLRSGKPLLLVITASDTMDEDEDADGNIIRTLTMKSDSVRQEQCEGLRAFIESGFEPQEVGLYEFSVVSVSARFACERKGSPETLWYQSGMQNFFTTMGQILEAQGECARMVTSLRDIRDCMKEMMATFVKIDAVNEAFSKDIVSFKKKLGEYCRNAAHEIASMKTDAICASTQEMAAEKKNEAFHAILKKHRTSSTNFFWTIVANKFGLTDPIKTKFMCSSMKSIPEYENIYSTTMRESSMGKGVGSTAGTAIGGAIGLMGGPIGAMIGGAVGSFVGAIGGSLFDGESETKVLIGDNRAVVAANANRLFEVWMTEVSGPIEKWVNDWVSPNTIQCVNELCVVTEKYKKAFNTIIENLEEELNHVAA